MAVLLYPLNNMDYYSIFSVTVKFNGGNMQGIFVQSRQTAGDFNTNHGYGSFESSGDSQPMKAYTCWGNTDVSLDFQF